MAIIKETVKVFFAGNSIELIKGNEIQDSSALVKAKPELFMVEETPKSKPQKKTIKTVKKQEPKEELKEELLVEAPIAELEVQIEEPKEEKPKRRKRTK